MVLASCANIVVLIQKIKIKKKMIIKIQINK